MVMSVSSRSCEEVENVWEQVLEIESENPTLVVKCKHEEGLYVRVPAGGPVSLWVSLKRLSFHWCRVGLSGPKRVKVLRAPELESEGWERVREEESCVTVERRLGEGMLVLCPGSETGYELAVLVRAKGIMGKKVSLSVFAPREVGLVRAEPRRMS